jgi:hypothetical protein
MGDRFVTIPDPQDDDNDSVPQEPTSVVSFVLGREEITRRVLG